MLVEMPGLLSLMEGVDTLEKASMEKGGVDAKIVFQAEIAAKQNSTTAAKKVKLPVFPELYQFIYCNVWENILMISQ